MNEPRQVALAVTDQRDFVPEFPLRMDDYPDVLTADDLARILRLRYGLGSGD